MIRPKTARKKTGLTQVELAKAAGVSRATVQRAEKAGITKNKKLLKVYENIEKNRKKEQEFKNLQKRVLKKMNKLEDRGLTKTPAYQNILNSGGIPSKSDILSDPSKYNRDIAKMKKFLSYQTSKIGGAKEWIKNISKASENTIGTNFKKVDFNGEDPFTIFWKVYNTLRYDRSLSKYWRYGSFDSEQLIQDIKIMISTRSVNGEKIKAEDIIKDIYDLN